MIALDTNILARFSVDDPGDPETAEQCPTARRKPAVDSCPVPVSPPLFASSMAKELNRVVPLDNFMIYKDIIRLDRPD